MNPGIQPRSLLFLFCCSVFLQCAEPSKDPKATANDTMSLDPADIRATLEQINGRLDRAVIDGDVDFQLHYFADSVIIDPPFLPVMKGKAILREHFEKNRSNGVTYRSFSTRTRDCWVSGNKAYERGTWGASMSSAARPAPVAYYGGYFQIWNVRDSIPRIEYLIYNLDHVPSKLHCMPGSGHLAASDNS